MISAITSCPALLLKDYDTLYRGDVQLARGNQETYTRWASSTSKDTCETTFNAAIGCVSITSTKKLVCFYDGLGELSHRLN